MGILVEHDAKASLTEANSLSASKTSEPAKAIHQFQEGMGSHPLWQEYLAELEASRQADIAEANRVADLELES